MVGKPQMTIQTLRVLRDLLAHPAAENYGLELARRCALSTGTTYPILGRLKRAGWIVGELEDIDESVAGRRRRRFYRFTDDGVISAKTALLDAQPAVG